MRRALLFLSVLALGAMGEDFITDFEYGQMLYHDPRGASCAECHGETGAGRLIAEYGVDGENITLQGPDIRQATYQQIKESTQKGRGVMPRYFLTDKEIRAIHAYLQQVNRHKPTGIAELFSTTEVPDKPNTPPIKSAE